MAPNHQRSMETGAGVQITLCQRSTLDPWNMRICTLPVNERENKWALKWQELIYSLFGHVARLWKETLRATLSAGWAVTENSWYVSGLPACSLHHSPKLFSTGMNTLRADHFLLLAACVKELLQDATLGWFSRYVGIRTTQLHKMAVMRLKFLPIAVTKRRKGEENVISARDKQSQPGQRYLHVYTRWIGDVCWYIIVP